MDGGRPGLQQGFQRRISNLNQKIRFQLAARVHDFFPHLILLDYLRMVGKVGVSNIP